jgi:hypothetical protein
MMERNPTDALLAIVPLLPPLILLLQLLDNPIYTVQRWIRHFLSQEESTVEVPSVGSQLLAYLTMAILGYVATSRMVPDIKQYTLRKGISGKDLGKQGTPLADKEMYVSE